MPTNDTLGGEVLDFPISLLDRTSGALPIVVGSQSGERIYSRFLADVNANSPGTVSRGEPLSLVKLFAAAQVSRLSDESAEKPEGGMES
jgi:hypothetical protein